MVEEEHESEHEESESSGDESEDEEPRIKDVLSHLSRAVSDKRAFHLLHSMAVSKHILLWTPRGQLLRNKRVIPVIKISELVEYVLLHHNNEVTKPRALYTFLDGLAELGIDKGLIKNKKLLSGLIKKGKNANEIVENTYENESNNEESSSDLEEVGEEEEEEEVASENGSEAEDTQESDNDTEKDSQKRESSNPETSTTFHSKSPCEHCESSYVYGTCPKCSWHDDYKICPICNHQIPKERITSKRAFYGVTKMRRRWKPISIPLLKRRTKKRIN